MENFREFINAQSGGNWSATKDEIIHYWQNIKPNMPIMPNAIPKDKHGSSYGYDGIRVTGTFEFVSSVMSRFKDFIYKESPHTRLNLVFRQVQDRNTHSSIADKYVFYVNVAERGSGKKPVPKLPKLS